MSEWWTYTLSDFLLFSPRTYYRLFELYHAEIWPTQILAFALGVTILVLLFRGGDRAGPAILLILAACWLFIAGAFHWHRYATINWAAIYVAAGFALQALLLSWVAFRRRLSFAPQPLALAVFVFALVVQPLIGIWIGRPWTQAELFGVTPDTTAVATVAVLAMSKGHLRWLLMVLPVLWCAITGVTLWTMGAVDAAVTPVAAMTALAAVARRRL
jgi:hypothetical protein